MEMRENRSKNAFEVLGDTTEDGMPKEKEEVAPAIKDIISPDGMETQQMEIVEEAEDEEMELSELDLEEIEAECGKKGKGYMPRRQIKLLQEEIIKAGAYLNLGIDPDIQIGHKWKPPEEEQCRGRKSNKQRIAELGVKLIESGQYPTIRVAFSEVSKVSQ